MNPIDTQRDALQAPDAISLGRLLSLGYDCRRRQSLPI